jgi:peptide deformylase
MSESTTREPLSDEEPVNPEGPGDEIEAELDAEARERRRLALAQVLTFGDPVLKSPAAPVSEFDEDLAREVERMVGIMRDALGVGLAATQLGRMRRVLVFQAGPDARPTALVNPEIEWRSEEGSVAEEGCLSLPGVIVEVDRPLHVRVRALDPSGAPLVVEGSGLEARVIQHEIDHLDGVLIVERTTRDQRKGALRALREGTAFSPDLLREPGDGEGDDAAAEAPAEATPAEA